MARQQKLLDSILGGRSDQSIRFDALISLLVTLGFDLRQKGSHHILSRTDVPEILNLQPRSDGTAKPYQVKQVREVITRHGLTL